MGTRPVARVVAAVAVSKRLAPSSSRVRGLRLPPFSLSNRPLDLPSPSVVRLSPSPLSPPSPSSSLVPSSTIPLPPRPPRRHRQPPCVLTPPPPYPCRRATRPGWHAALRWFCTGRAGRAHGGASHLRRKQRV